VYATLSANKSSYLNTNTQAGVVYRYRVTALGSTGNSAGVEVSVTTPSAVPSAPTSLQGSAEGTVVSLTWTDTSGFETSFEVQRSVTGTSYAAAGTVAAAPANGPVSFTLYETVENRSIYYRVVAKNAFGASAASNVVVVRTQGTVTENGSL
jgi:predicted phage tail protein